MQELPPQPKAVSIPIPQSCLTALLTLPLRLLLIPVIWIAVQFKQSVR
jgi:hypothetical protein